MKKYLSLQIVFLISITAMSHPVLPQFDGRADTVIAAPYDTLEYELNEVIVTGTRGEKKLIDIPYSVMRLNVSSYKYERRIAIDDVLGSVPGLFMQSRYGNHDVRISIRGFGSRSNTGIRGIRILLDGIPESEPDGQTRIEAIDFNSIGSIEIVKGNASSLYTNAPGGVINFINDLDFRETYLLNFNQFGSFGLRRNGFKSGVVTENYKLLTTYSYHNFSGYREHDTEYWHILNMVLETNPGDNTNLKILGYFVDGLLRLPGSLTRKEFEEDPFQADSNRALAQDQKRLSKKGRLGLRFNTQFGESLNNDLEITTYGTIKYFHRTSGDYRIINRYGLGATVNYRNKSTIAGRLNEFSLGGDLLYQTGPVESYRNINGQKDDLLKTLTDETIANTGFYIQESYEFIENKLSLFLTGRYDKVIFDHKNQLFAAQNDIRRFEAFTPKIALNYKFTPMIAFYTSYGLSFDSPAGNELDYNPVLFNTNNLLNPDLRAQKSKNFEAGIKGNIINPGNRFLSYLLFEATFFHLIIDDEIVPFEMLGLVFFRNSAKTIRTGLELGADLEIYTGVKFNFTYTLSKFKYDEYKARVTDLNFSTTEKDFSGNIVPTVPEHNISLSLMYEHQLFYSVAGFSKASFRHISGMFVDDANSERADAYSLLDATIGFDVLLDDYNISLNIPLYFFEIDIDFYLPLSKFNILFSGGINNIFDLRYAGFINVNSSEGKYYELGEPRSYFAGINIAYRF